MVELPVMLAKRWHRKKDVTGWWASEKYDGVRALLQVDTGKMVTRGGHLLHPPGWWMERALRSISTDQGLLDGELWMGRGTYAQTMRVVMHNKEGWERVVYCVFDVPSLGDRPFEERVAWLTKHVAGDPVRVAPQWRVESNDHLTRRLAEVVGAGGEGLMLRLPGSLYEERRSASMLKAKDHREGWGRVVAYKLGKASAGAVAVGSVQVEVVEPACGKRLLYLGLHAPRAKARPGEVNRENPPKIGSVARFKYQSLTPAGLPRFATHIP
jgi:DNA ligase-1